MEALRVRLFGSASYAASRISRWRKRKPSSPGRSGAIRADQLLADERREPRGHRETVGRRAPAPRRDGTPRLRSRPARARSARPSRAGRSARRAAPADVGGTVTSPCVSSAIASISPTKSGLPPAARAIRSRSVSGDAVLDELVDVGGRRAARAGVSTGQPGRSSPSSGRARQSSRIGAPDERSATCSTRSRNVSSAHWMSSKRTTRAAEEAACSSVLRNAQAISSADVGAADRPSSGSDRAPPRARPRIRSSCLRTPTTGQ